jgi:hypothetical protein
MVDYQSMTCRATEAANETRKVARHHATSDVVFDEGELEFLRAMEEFKVRHDKKFPTWTDCLGVLRALGYVKIQWDDEPVDVVLAG